MRIASFSRKIISVILIAFLSSVERLFSAEEIDVLVMDISIDYSNDPFYSKLWFWIIIAAVLFFFLVLLIRGGRKKTEQAAETTEE
ncbi:MAG: hypothetical protein PHV53_03905 [Fermentimonas sp.]|nr:hypothetical protein [Fermentimonas sp.]